MYLPRAGGCTLPRTIQIRAGSYQPHSNAAKNSTTFSLCNLLAPWSDLLSVLDTGSEPNAIE
jgi:hypothetical protein